MPFKITEEAYVKGHKSAVYALDKNPDNEIFFSGGGDGRVIMWNRNDPANAKIIAKVPAVHIFSLLYLPEQDHLLIGQMQGGVHVVDLNDNKEIRFLQFHEKEVFVIVSDPARSKILIGSGDGTISLWNSKDYSFIKKIRISDKSIRNIHFHPNEEKAAIGCSDNHIYILDFETEKILKKFEGHQNSVFTVQYGKNGDFLYSGGRDGRFNIWDVKKNYELYLSIPAHALTVNKIAISPDHSLIATASRDNTIRVWDPVKLKLLKVINREKGFGHQHSVNDIIWLDNDYLVSASDDRHIGIWKFKKLEHDP